MKINAYWRLLRFDKPVGTLLLWFPTAWALWIADRAMPSFGLLFLFLSGTVLMRAAGCVINDIADRHLDKHVARTKERPLASGVVSVWEALVLFTILLLAAFVVLLYLPQSCVIWAVLAAFVSILYPFCKRFINAPQMVLGLAFSMGIPMAFVAEGVNLNEPFLALFLINFLWILAYDTMYAMTDREDDLKIGIKSTAIYFAQYDCLIIGTLQLFLHLLWLYLAYLIEAKPIFYLFWMMALGVQIYQQLLIKNRNAQECFKAFLTSVYYGTLMWVAVIVAV